MTINVKLPRPGAAALCVLAACACAANMGAYFGAAWGGMLSFLCCLLLLLLALLLRPKAKEAIACGLSGGVFSLMHTLGYSYDTIDSYGLILKSTATLLRGADGICTHFTARIRSLAICRYRRRMEMRMSCIILRSFRITATADTENYFLTMQKK